MSCSSETPKVKSLRIAGKETDIFNKITFENVILMLKNKDDGILLLKDSVLLLEEFMNSFKIVSFISTSGRKINWNNEIPLENLVSMSNNEDNGVLQPEKFMIVSEMAISRSVNVELKSKIKIWINLALVEKFGLFRSLDPHLLLTVLKDWRFPL